MQAAKAEGEAVDFLELDRVMQNTDALMERITDKTIVKIDPPVHDTDQIREIKALGAQYTDFLDRLAKIPGICWLNTPTAIRDTLNKTACKKRLQMAGVPVTPMIMETVGSLSKLQEYMKDHRIRQVFIKPILGSGAAGVMAYRFHPGTNKQALYTAARQVQGLLVNTKQIRRYDRPEDIRSLVSLALSVPCMAEQWIPKDSILEQGYDLRVVYQFGRIEYAVARLSRSPLTNLHLNNHGIAAAELDLGVDIWAEISQLCESGLALFPGLRSAGFDILLTKHSRRPKIIEINGQGDLIHQDIYGKNRIYRNQIRRILDERDGRTATGVVSESAGTDTGY